MIVASTATKSAPALGVKDWLETVRMLAPNARIPYIAAILAEAYEHGLSPRQVAEALADLRPHINWPADISSDGWVGDLSLSN
jgi:hypothetical protein